MPIYFSMEKKSSTSRIKNTRRNIWYSEHGNV
jgi:hypothetical protein